MALAEALLATDDPLGPQGILLVRIRVVIEDAPAPWQDTYVMDTGEIEGRDITAVLEEVDVFLLKALRDMRMLAVRETR